jgi:hypothetical protein
MPAILLQNGLIARTTSRMFLTILGISSTDERILRRLRAQRLMIRRVLVYSQIFGFYSISILNDKTKKTK